MKKKYIYIGIGLMITLMVGYLVIWGINVRSYAPYIREEDVVYSSANGYLMETEGNILYYVKKPSFPSFVGNLVGQTRDDQISVFIWPSLFGNGVDERGVFLKTEDGTEVFLLYVTATMEYDPQKSTGLDEVQEAQAKELLQERRAEVLQIYVSAICYFRIDGWHAIVSEELLDMSLQGHKT